MWGGLTVHRTGWAPLRAAAWAALGLAVLGPAPAHGQSLRGAVIRVVDGDTIHVRVHGRDEDVRLLGVDSPETHRPGTPVQCLGPAAAARTVRLLPPGLPVRLETDPTQARRDRYGRLLAYVYPASTPRAAAATGSVNYALVATGYAKLDIYRGRPFRYATAFRRAQSRARSSARGLWGPPCRGDTTKPDPSSLRP
jgi:micrococcal nuclease